MALVPPPLPRPVAISGPRLLYRDDNGEHVHPINKDLIKIGRGGAEHWVDVMVSAGAQVSREHCRIRRDAAGDCSSRMSAPGALISTVSRSRSSWTARRSRASTN